jgi:hypothetical protein
VKTFKNDANLQQFMGFSIYLQTLMGFTTINFCKIMYL